MSYKTANRDINALQPLAQEACRLFMAECKRQGVKIFITETQRPQKRQNWLHSQGRSRPGKIVTHTKNSNHTSGYAWDIAVSPPKNLYDYNELAKAGKVAGEIGVEWGGTWTRFKDNPHFQIDKNWKNPRKTVTKPTKSKFSLNGKVVELDGFLEDGRTYVVIRPLLEPLGIRVDWDNKTKSVTADGRPITMNKVIRDGKTYVVARPLLEALGFSVGWDNSSKTVIVK